MHVTSNQYKTDMRYLIEFHRALSKDYEQHIYPYMVPVVLPIAQIAMTASVYMTVVLCFDRYSLMCSSKYIFGTTYYNILLLVS